MFILNGPCMVTAPSNFERDRDAVIPKPADLNDAVS